MRHFIVFISVFIAEIGDKTQLATMLFATDNSMGKLGVFFAAAGALVASTLLAVVAGSLVTTVVPASTLKLAVDGYELIKRIRTGASRHVKLPAVALTALTRVEDRVKALAAGYHMHVAKPVEPTELLTVVASLAALRKHR